MTSNNIHDHQQGQLGVRVSGGTGQPAPDSAEDVRQQILSGRQGLSAEEQRVLTNCNLESFFQRALPLAVLGGTSAMMAVHRGLLNPHPRFGATPKAVLIGGFMYFVGKFSYSNICADKILNEIPDSNLANAIRLRRGLPVREQDPSQQAHLQQQTTSQDEIFLPSGSGESAPSSNSYEALRKQHREGYSTSMGQPQPRFPAASPMQPPPPSQPEISQQDPNYAPPSKLRKRTVNKYGDEGFE